MIAFWLMPAPPHRDLLLQAVQDLAARYDAPVFLPHVTLLAGEFDQQRALASLPALSSSTALELELESIRCSEVFTKTVFVQFRPSAAASKLSSRIRDEIAIDCKYDFDPHLSLIYKTMTAEQKQEIVDRMALPFDRVTFDRVRLICGREHTRTAEDVNAWSTLGEHPLL